MLRDPIRIWIHMGSYGNLEYMYARKVTDIILAYEKLSITTLQDPDSINRLEN